MLGERQRLEALGIGLLALGVLITLATLYPALASTEANLIGPAGAAVYRWGSAAFGLLTFLITVPAFAWGAYCLRLTGRESAIRMSILGPGLMLLLPSGFWLLLGASTDRGLVRPSQPGMYTVLRCLDTLATG